MKKRGITTLWLLMVALVMMAKSYTVTSPNGQLTAQVEVGTVIKYSLKDASQQLVLPSAIALKTDRGTWGENSHLRRAVKTTHRGQIAAFAYKRNEVSDCYNQLCLQFKEGFDLIFRLYDEGMAYRFASTLKSEVTINDEQAQMRFARDWKAQIPYVRDSGDREDQLHNSFENNYTHTALSQLMDTRLIFTPLIVEADKGVRLCVAESDVEHYPGLFWIGNGKTPELTGVCAPYPSGIKIGGYRLLEQLPTGRVNYLVKAHAQQQFPWRIICYATADEQLLDNDMVYRLASPSRLADTSWIRPGKVAWDWWNAWNLYGVDFRAGINNDTYKYYIDFAASHGIEYVILDEGWAVNKKADLMQVIPEIDLPMLCGYARERGVGLILWAGYWAFDRDMENVCRHYSEMGVKGFKVDFMDRDDQMMVDFHRRAAEMAAKYHLMIDFHGTYKPAGLNRTWPNVVNYEGVHGLEQMKWSPNTVDQVTYDVTVPFIRMAAGPMDYTQGAMRNSTKKNYRPVNTEAMSQGTRCRQLAEYVVFESPLNMLCDSPSNYMAEPLCTKYIADCPVVWAESIAVNGEISKYITLARRSGDVWYVGSMTDWSARDLDIDLSFLGDGHWTMEIFCDGINADRAARDFRHEIQTVPENRQVKIHMAPGGGWAARITKE